MKTRFTVLSVLLCVPFAVAQDMNMSPAKELQKFAPMVGTWEGKGIMREGPTSDVGKWTAKSSSRWVLNGHFLREDTRIEFDTMPNSLEFHNFYGWDRENERYVVIEVNNLGTAGIKELHWTADDKYVQAETYMMMGMPIMDRWVTTVGDEVISFVGHEAQGDGDFFEHVTGEMKRTDKKHHDVAITNAAFVPEMTSPLVKKMKKFAPICGEYKMNGWFLMAADGPKTDFSGIEKIKTIFDGSLVELHAKGDPIPGMPDYEGLAWFSWEDHAGCYKLTYINNMGELSSQEARFMNDKIVFTQSTLHQGQPTCTRGVVTLTDGGAWDKFSSHMLVADQPPMEMFAATYVKQ